MEDLSAVNQRVGGGELKKEKQDAEDAFNRLTDELILSHIFAKISEAKSLCFLSTVSKRFSSLIFQSRTVAIKIPLPIPDQQLTDRHAPVNLVSNLTNKFLVKFTFMKTLYVEFDCSANSICKSCTSAEKEPVVKWKIDLESASMVMLFARTLDDDIDVDDDIGEKPVDLICTCFLAHLKDASYRLLFMKALVCLLPESLEIVVVTDSKKQGGMINNGGSEAVDVQILKRFNVRNILLLVGNKAIKYWHEKRLLKLPFSGSEMKRVTVIRYKESWVDNEDDFLAVKAAFLGEEEVIFAEAAKELLTKSNIDRGLGFL